MIIDKTPRDKYFYNQRYYVCDYKRELYEFPEWVKQFTVAPDPGSEIEVTEEYGTVYVLNSNMQWVKKISSVNSGGSGDGSGENIVLAIEENKETKFTKTYQLLMNGEVIGTIDIPGISSGQVVENPSDKPQGFYIEITIADEEDTKLYIPCDKLRTVYDVQKSATKVQLKIENNVISATIVSHSIGTEELSIDIGKQLDDIKNHLTMSIASEKGAHNLRWNNGKLEYYDEKEWKILNLREFLI